MSPGWDNRICNMPTLFWALAGHLASVFSFNPPNDPLWEAPLFPILKMTQLIWNSLHDNKRQRLRLTLHVSDSTNEFSLLFYFVQWWQMLTNKQNQIKLLMYKNILKAHCKLMHSRIKSWYLEFNIWNIRSIICLSKVFKWRFCPPLK